jgi:hypothetical protein
MKFNFVALLLFLSYAATAQWSDAKLVLTNSDTLVGRARLRYDTIAFRVGNAKASYYSSAQVKSVMMNNETYFSSDYLKLPASGNSNSFFVKALVQGDIVLYYRDDNPKDANSQPSFFIGKKESPMIELLKLEKKIFKDGLWYTQYYDAYKNQLSDFFKDCPNQIIDIKKNFFTQPLMTKVVEQYASCKNLSLKKNSVSEVKPALSLLTGIDYSHFKFTSDEFAFRYINNVSTSSTMPFAGLKLELPVKHSTSTKLVLETILKMTRISFNAYKISVTYMKLNIGGEKIFRLNNKSALELHAGFALNPIIGSKFTSPDPSNTSFGFKTFEIGTWYGAGLNFERIGFFVRNENFFGGFTSFENLTMSGSYLYGGLKYKLRK